MTTKEKKKVQVMIDQQTAIDAENILSKLGINPTTAINALYTRIVATNSLPFSLELSEDEKADLQLKSALAKLPVEEIKTQKDMEDFINED